MDLPANENFVVEYVTKQVWSAYNWYKGNAQSLIQVNTDFPTEAKFVLPIWRATKGIRATMSTTPCWRPLECGSAS